MITAANRVLFRFFFDRFFQTDAARLSPLVALLLIALPGTILSLLLMEKYSALARFGRRMFVWNPDLASLPDRYLFLALAASIAGCAAVLRLDALFPDRRDVVHLSPLPVSAGMLLGCRAAALICFVAAVILFTNAGSTLLFPAVVYESSGTLNGLVRFMISHAAATTLASAWAFAVVLAMEGAVLVLLPFRAYRHVKRYVRFTMMAGFVGLLVSAPAGMAALRALLNGEPAGWLTWMPTLWFLGLHVEVQGFAAGPLNQYAANAVSITAITILVALVTWTVGCQWRLRQLAEHPTDSTAGFQIADRRFALLDRWFLPRAFERGCFRFVLRTLLRSDRHAAMFTSVAGCGAGLALLTLSFHHAPDEPAARGVLACMLMVFYSVLTALRVAFSIPSEPAAAWLFQIVSDETVDPQRITTRILWTAAAGMIAVSTVVLGSMYGVRVGLLHLLFTGVLGTACIQLLTSGFRVLPFTCNWMPARNNLLLGGAAWLSGLAVFAFTLAPFEASYLKAPHLLIWFLGVAVGLLLLMRRGVQGNETVVWQDTRGDFDLLHLTE